MNALRHLLACCFWIGAVMVACAAASALTGCGGGDEEDVPADPPPVIGPVDCKTRPEVCA